MKIKSIVFATVSLLALNAAAKVNPGKGPALKIGGSLTATAVGVKQQVRYTPTTSVQTKGNIMFNVGGESSNGLVYGGAAVLNVDRAKSSSDRISEAYVYLTHKDAGTFMIGDTQGVESTMMYSGTDVLGGNGGPANSDLSKVVNTPVGVDWRTSLSPDDDTASKIVWISPNVSGFQLGLSFTPNTGSYGRTPTSRYFNSSGTLSGGGISSSKPSHRHSGEGKKVSLDLFAQTLDSTLRWEINCLQSHSNFLATVGSIAPFIGLLGIVWGIMHSFQSIAVS